MTIDKNATARFNTLFDRNRVEFVGGFCKAFADSREIRIRAATRLLFLIRCR